MNHGIDISISNRVVNFAEASLNSATSVQKLCEQLARASKAFKVACDKHHAAELAAVDAYPEPAANIQISHPENLILLPLFKPNGFGGPAIPAWAIREELSPLKNNCCRKEDGRIIISDVPFPLTEQQESTAASLEKQLISAMEYERRCRQVDADISLAELESAMDRASARELSAARKLVRQPASNGADLLAKLAAYHKNRDLFSSADEELDLAGSIANDLSRFAQSVDLAAIMMPH